MPPDDTEGVGKLARCPLCGEFYFAPRIAMCSGCVMAITDIRIAIESRGGSVLIVDDRVVVRTAVQRRDPVEALGEIADIQRALNHLGGRA